MIKAPYNFVPLSSKVVFPEWGTQISIDKPFEDGVSGTIEVEYTTKTPVFIGNGKKDNNTVNSNYKAANGKYAIPGSSIRGMLRNIIEIAAFGKFNRVSDAALSVRDLQNRELYSAHLTLDKGNRTYESLSKAGWLVYEDNMWFLYPVVYHRVEDKNLEEVYPSLGDLRKRNEFELRIRPIMKDVSVYFSTEETDKHRHHGGMTLVYSKIKNLKRQKFSGAKHGFTVLTGQPGRSFNKKQNREVGKHLDFIFEDKGTNKIEVSYETLLQFKQANTPKASDQKRGLDLTKKLNDCKKIGYPGIPVFYLPDSSGYPNSLGLSLMYRLPYKNTLHDAIKNSSEDNFSDMLDFAECMFGKIRNTKKASSEYNFSLRGRVQFEDAITNNGVLSSQVYTILGNPKSTYYPNYIEQNSNNSNYKTLMDNDVRLRGWKRYPVRNKPNPMTVGADQKNVASSFQPLQQNTIFSGRIHFHNLKKEELGALLWAITWGNDKSLSHAVGMGKTYGFGQITAEISSLEYLNNNSSDNIYKMSSENERNFWINLFTDYMEKNIVGWGSCSQINELKAMANPKNAERKCWDLSHMSLKDENKRNQFVDAKKSYSILASYSSDTQEIQFINNRQSGEFRNNKNYSIPQKIVHSENGVSNGSIQICVLLEEKTKKGCWKAAVKESPEISGPIINTTAVPGDKKAGDEIKLTVTSVNRNNSNFKYNCE